MTELLKVNYENDQPTVSARELHEFLDVNTRFNDWFPRMCEYGFVEGVDFNLLKIERVQNEGGRMVERIVDDAALTIEMGKELCMIQRNDRGKQARQYFIQLEKDWNSPEKVMARALKIANIKIQSLQSKNLILEQKVSEYEPKAQYVDQILQSTSTMTITQIAADYDLTAYQLNKILNEEHIQHKVGGQWILYKEHMNLGYTKSDTIHFVHCDGRMDTKLNTKWTQKGRLMIHALLGKYGIKANVDREMSA